MCKWPPANGVYYTREDGPRDNWHWQIRRAIKVQASALKEHTQQSLWGRRKILKWSWSLCPAMVKKTYSLCSSSEHSRVTNNRWKTQVRAQKAKETFLFLLLWVSFWLGWESAHMSALKTIQFFPFVFLSLLVPTQGSYWDFPCTEAHKPHFYTVLLDS